MEIYQEISNLKIVCHMRNYDTTYHGLHWHENYEICRVDSETCRFLVDGEMIYAKKGDLICIGEHVVHRFLIDNMNTVVCIFQFPMSILLNANTPVGELKTHIKAEDIAACEGLAKDIDELFSVMLRHSPINSGSHDAFMQNLASAVFFLLAKNFSEEKTAANRRRRREFYDMVEYINAHLSDDLSVNALSERFFIPRGRLAALFSTYAGVGVSEYVNSMRIRRVNELLLDGVSVTEAAMESGFQSIRTFNNVYKRLTGMTPSEYAGSASSGAVVR